MEDNKLIAEFMGAEWHKDFFKDVCIISPSNISYKFHTSWEWLMPVVEKIENLGYDVIIRQGTCEIEGENEEGIEYSHFECFDASKHITTYTAVVEFIKTYNLNTSK